MSDRAALEPVVARKPALTTAPRPLVQRKCGCDGAGECGECSRKRPLVQRRAVDAGAQTAAPESVQRTLSSPGRPLDAGTRDFMESRFGHDFGSVRVHTDNQAGDSARDIHAHAYTSGDHIAFAPGKYQPDSHSGRELLAHELAHTVQQEGLQRRASNLAVDTAPDSRLEHEADAAARAVMEGRGPPGIGSRPAGATVSRAKGDIDTADVTPKKAKAKTTNSGLTHKVTPTGVGSQEIGTKGNTEDLAEFSVEPFFLPATKGPNAFAIYDGMATGGSLESTLELTGSGRTKTALWQERPDTDELRSVWLQKVGWDGQTADTVDDLWQRSGGEKEFPKVKEGSSAITAQMDHIVELQIGGNNTKENIQPLEPTPNRQSGGAIKGQLQTLAQAIANDPALCDPNVQQVKMRFTKVTPHGTPAPLPTACPPKGAKTALAIESCALKLQVTKSATGAITVKRVDYPITAGGRPPTSLQVPVTFASRADETVTIHGDSENDAASTLIPGLLLRALSHRKKQTARPDLIEAQIDDRDKTRLPITLNEKAAPFLLDVAADGNCTLPKALKKTALGFTYRYLSPGTIDSITMNAAGGIDWTGKITPTAKFLPTLDVEYKEGTLRLIAQVPEEKLKKAKLFGAKVTKASLEVVLSPAFDVTGNLEFLFGSETKPMATGKLTLGKDDQGIVGTAKLQLLIPKVDAAEITAEYKGGKDREEWSGELRIESSQIKLPYVTSGSLLARVTSKGGVTDVTFDGKLSLELPRKRGTAEVGLQRWGGKWVLYGIARLNIPKVEDFSAGITYDVGSEQLNVKVPAKEGGKPSKPITFTITEDFKGTLEQFELEISNGHVSVSGKGGFQFKKGKASGNVNVELEKDGSFNGDGSIKYQLSDNITVDGSVAFKEKGTPKLSIKGSLTFAKITLMDAISDDRTLFEKDFSIPIPYASIGGVGLKAFFEIKFTAGYSLGPIVVEPLVFTAGFNPLDEEPQLNLGASGQLKMPASATLSASLSGGVKLDAFVAEIGGKITITGTIKLKGGLFVPFSGTYSNKEFSVEMTPEAKLQLLLGVALTATVWAKAGIGWLSVKTEKTWTLAQKEIDTKLGFGIKAPISYNSRTGANFPSLDTIEFVPPDFSSSNLSRIADELFSGAGESEREI
jgi:hypothetical protein